MHPRAQYRSAYNKAPEWMSDRIDVLKYLRQGDGLTVERVSALEDDQLRALYPSDEYLKPPEAVYNLIRWAALSLVDDQYSLAIRNALGIGDDVAKGNLTDRRERFSKSRGITLRTLINHEDAGIELLAQQIDITASKQDIGTVDLTEVATNVEKLRARLDRAERENWVLRSCLLVLGNLVGSDWERTFWMIQKTADNLTEVVDMDEGDFSEWSDHQVADMDEFGILQEMVPSTVDLDTERLAEILGVIFRTADGSDSSCIDKLKRHERELEYLKSITDELSEGFYDTDLQSALPQRAIPGVVKGNLRELRSTVKEILETVNSINDSAREREIAQNERLDAIEERIRLHGV